MKINATTHLAAIAKLAFDVIPLDPARPEYRQGHTLGDEHKHWFRAKFFQQYRLFLRFHESARVIVFAWVNDEDMKRTCESADDAYRVFRRMLDSGRPPPSGGLDSKPPCYSKSGGRRPPLSPLANKRQPNGNHLDCG